MSRPGPSNDDLRQLRRKDLPDCIDLMEEDVSVDIFESGRSSSWRGRGDITEPSRNTKMILNYVMPVPSGNRGLDRNGFPLYVELVFRQTDDRSPVESAVKMFRALGIKDQVLHNLTDLLATRQTMNQVWIPADLAYPYGWFFNQLGDASHPHRLKGLLINMLGAQNPIMCKGCIRSYTTNKSWNLEQFIGDGNCEWADLPGYIPNDPQEGTFGYALQGKKSVGGRDPKGWSLDQLNPDSAPRITLQWPVHPRKPDETQAQYNSRVKEATDNITKRLKSLDLD
ncbi:hypothetical protein ACLX1H_011345 [Fusarium chlamydosporum]